MELGVDNMAALSPQERRASIVSGHSRNSWIDLDDEQPIPWGARRLSTDIDSAAASISGISAGAPAASSSLSPPPGISWRSTPTPTRQSVGSSFYENFGPVSGSASRSHSRSHSATHSRAGSTSNVSVHTTSGPLGSGLTGQGHSRSRVSMDAVIPPTNASHHSAASSVTSLTTVDLADTNPNARRRIRPASMGSVSTRGTYGLGLTALNHEDFSNGKAGGTYKPRSRDIASEVYGTTDDEFDDGDGYITAEAGTAEYYTEEESRDTHDMETYMASHRAPIDVNLRSMPGVVGLGDGWAGGPQTKSKQRWFSRKKRASKAPPQHDPLALWAISEHGDSPTVATPILGVLGAPTSTPPTSSPQPGAASAKWWRSKTNLFSASTRALPTFTQAQQEEAMTMMPASQQKPPGKARALLNKSKVNFTSSMVDLGRTLHVTTPATTTSDKSNSKRHSLAVFSRKSAARHPLDRPLGPASTSQPTFSLSPDPLPAHPLLRQAYARSESHLIAAGGPLPPWRPSVMSPVPLQDVAEEDEHSPSMPLPVPLQRTRTFGDDHDAHSGSGRYAPALATVTASPLEPPQPLFVSIPDPPQVITEPYHSPPDAHPQALSLLNRLKSKWGFGKSRSTTTMSSPSTAQLHGEVPGTPHPSSRPASSMSFTSKKSNTAHSSRPMSRLFGRRRENANESRTNLATAPTIPSQEEQVAPVKSSIYTLSKNIVASMISLSNEPTGHVQSTPAAPVSTKGKIQTSSVTSTPRPYIASRTTSLGSPSPITTRTSSLASPITPILPISPIAPTRKPKHTSWAMPLKKRRSGAIFNGGLEDEVTEGGWRGSQLGRRKTTGKNRSTTTLGSVFPHPPEMAEPQAPPTLNWTFPVSFSTPVLNKFGGSTLSLALDFSTEGGLDIEDILDNTRRQSVIELMEQREQRERALAATIATLTTKPAPSVQRIRVPELYPIVTEGTKERRRTVTEKRRSQRRSVQVNVDNLANSSTESLSFPQLGKIIDFPLPPSADGDGDGEEEVGEASSPDPEVEQLRTPRNARQYGPLPPVAKDYCYSPHSAERTHHINHRKAKSVGVSIDTDSTDESTVISHLANKSSWSSMGKTSTSTATTANTATIYSATTPSKTLSSSTARAFSPVVTSGTTTSPSASITDESLHKTAVFDDVGGRGSIASESDGEIVEGQTAKMIVATVV